MASPRPDVRYGRRSVLLLSLLAAGLAAVPAQSQIPGYPYNYGQNYGQNYGRGGSGWLQPQINPYGFSGSFSPAQGFGVPGGWGGGGIGGNMPGMMGGMMGYGPGSYGGLGAAGQSSNVLFPAWGMPSPGFSGSGLFPTRPGEVPIGGGLLNFPRGERGPGEPAQSPGGLVGPLSPLPSWLSSSASGAGAGRTEAKPMRNDRFHVIRYSERIEVRPAGEKAFFPIQFWKKRMELAGDSEVRVFSTDGHGLLIFPDGTRLELVGPASLRVTELNEDRVSMRVDSLTTFRLAGGRRPSKVFLPEGTVLEVRGAELSVDREEMEQILGVRNFGPAPITLVATLGEIRLDPNQRCELPLVLNTHPRPAADLQGGGAAARGAGNEAVRASGDARMQVDGRILTVEGGSGESAVRWGGASFRLNGGRRLILDPLQGDRFPLGVEPVDPPPKASPTRAPASESAR